MDSVREYVRLALEERHIGIYPDSLALVRLVIGLETTFGVTIDDEELTLDYNRTVEGLIALVEGKVNTRSTPKGFL